ncbi:hypothetical protein ONV78_07775 [Hahella sp. CR1]|uniref:HEAT repeat domain-containing protein n=1 Tax=Hahella sp. CR1 TaxID=2992807 RepID=UPI00244265EE|nr:hypothetical protein [Hahella sp. CR1]MDG9667625.1 hypothetical protein [Hahella sp. CR1]
MGSWKDIFNRAVSLWSSRNRLLENIYSVDDEEVGQLVSTEAEYENNIQELAKVSHAEECRSVIADALKGNELRCTVACHIIIESHNSDLESLLLERIQDKSSYTHRRMAAALRVCTKDTILRFGQKALELNRLWIDEALSSLVAKNMLHELLPFYITDNRLKHVSTDFVSMIGYLGAKSCLSQIRALMNDSSNDIYTRLTCAQSLLMAGDDEGLQFYIEALTNKLDDGTLAFTIAEFSSPRISLELLEREANTHSAIESDLVSIVKALGLTGSINAIDKIKPYLSHHSEEVRATASLALTEITGEWDIDEYSDAGELTSFWNDWLNINLANFDPKVRYTKGEVFCLMTKAENMLDSDQESRSIFHDDLIVYSGLHLPYDSKSYFIIQQQHVEEWKSAIINGTPITTGLWLRNGKKAE